MRSTRAVAGLFRSASVEWCSLTRHRFHLDPACYGVVRRPVAEYFPEHRVLWPKPSDSRDRPSYFMGYISSWRHVIQGRQKPDISEGSRIWNFFLSLALRLGHTIFTLERERAKRASDSVHPAVPDLRGAINRWQRASARLQTANPEPTPEELAIIRTKIIDEVSANETMLAPGREHRYFDGDGNPQTILVRDHNWDWASLVVRGQPKRRQFWSLNRWPLDAGYLSEKAELAIKNDENLDPAMTYDPASLDPTDKRYMRPKLRPYREEKVVFRPGPAIYPVGDTRLQREALQESIMEMVEAGKTFSCLCLLLCLLHIQEANAKLFF